MKKVQYRKFYWKDEIEKKKNNWIKKNSLPQYRSG